MVHEQRCAYTKRALCRPAESCRGGRRFWPRRPRPRMRGKVSRASHRPPLRPPPQHTPLRLPESARRCRTVCGVSSSPADVVGEGPQGPECHCPEGLGQDRWTWVLRCSEARFLRFGNVTCSPEQACWKQCVINLRLSGSRRGSGGPRCPSEVVLLLRQVRETGGRCVLCTHHSFPGLETQVCRLRTQRGGVLGRGGSEGVHFGF